MWPRPARQRKPAGRESVTCPRNRCKGGNAAAPPFPCRPPEGGRNRGGGPLGAGGGGQHGPARRHSSASTAARSSFRCAALIGVAPPRWRRVVGERRRHPRRKRLSGAQAGRVGRRHPHRCRHHPPAVRVAVSPRRCRTPLSAKAWLVSATIRSMTAATAAAPPAGRARGRRMDDGHVEGDVCAGVGRLRVELDRDWTTGATRGTTADKGGPRRAGGRHADCL